MLQDGDLKGAEALYREVLAACIESLDERHLETLTAVANLADLLISKAQLDEAGSLLGGNVNTRHAKLGDANVIAREVLGANHTVTLTLEATASATVACLCTAVSYTPDKKVRGW